MTYFSHAGGARMALPAIRASVASAITSTPGMTGSTGVGLASFRPDAEYPTSTTRPFRSGAPEVRTRAD